MAAADPLRVPPRRPVPLTIPPGLVPPLMHPGMYLYDPQMKMMAEYQHNCVKTAALSGVVGFGMGGLMGLFMSSMRYDTPFHTPTPENTPGYVAPAVAGAGGPTAPMMTTTTTTTTPPTTAQSVVSSTTPSSAPSAIRSAATASPSITTTASATSTTVSAASTTSTASTLATSGAPTITTTASPPASAALSSSSAAAAPTTTTAHPSAPSSTPAAFRPPEPTTMAQVRAGFRDMGKQSFSMARNFGKIGLIFSGVECGIEGMRGRNDATNGIAAGCLTGGVLARNSGPYAVATGCAGFAVFSAAVEAYLRSEGSEE